jgi:diguanylate cyclase (GGDEF)-like protein
MSRTPAEPRRALRLARSTYMEQPAAALAEAVRCHEIARSHDDASLLARARALQGAVALHRGELHGALALAAEAEQHAGAANCDEARTEVAALKAQIAFFTGSYADALREAELAIRLADGTGDRDLRVFARRSGCIVFGNVGVSDWPERLEEVLRLTVESGDRWHEATSRNDLACLRQERGELAAAEEEMARAFAVAGRVEPNRFLLAVLHSTRADIRLLGDRPNEALADAERSLELLGEAGDPSPYVFAATVRAEVQALMTLGRLDDAQRSGEGALSRLGDRLPQARSTILAILAGALREAGRLEEAYDALARTAELERQAFREMSELQLQLERATLEVSAARLQADALRDEAERDWLTGLHNRRYLARELERLGGDRRAHPVSLAVLDLDHFKSVNDRYGHGVGDQVLVRVAALLNDVLRRSDVVVRSGGEEFVVLMPATRPAAAVACCERIRAAIGAEPWGEIAPGLRMSASAGVATAGQPGDLGALAELADERLYAAKRGGRDRVVGGEIPRTAPPARAA